MEDQNHRPLSQGQKRFVDQISTADPSWIVRYLQKSLERLIFNSDFYGPPFFPIQTR